MTFKSKESHWTRHFNQESLVQTGFTNQETLQYTKLSNQKRLRQIELSSYEEYPVARSLQSEQSPVEILSSQNSLQQTRLFNQQTTPTNKVSYQQTGFSYQKDPNSENPQFMSVSLYLLEIHLIEESCLLMPLLIGRSCLLIGDSCLLESSLSGASFLLETVKIGASCLLDTLLIGESCLLESLLIWTGVFGYWRVS